MCHQLFRLRTFIRANYETDLFGKVMVDKFEGNRKRAVVTFWVFGYDGKTYEKL